MSKYISVPSLFGSIQALCAAFVVWLFGGTMENLLMFSLRAFAIGSLLGLILVLVHNVATRRAVKENKGGTAGLRQVHSELLNLPYDAAYKLCVDSLRAVDGRIKQEDRLAGKIEAETGGSMKTSGERILYTLNRVDDRTTKVHVFSEPALSTAMLDFGKNLENVGNISRFLETNGVGKSQQ